MTHTAHAQPPENLTEEQIAERRAPVISVAELKQVLGAPTTLTLHLKDATPQATLNALVKQAEQAGIRVRTWPPHQELQVNQPVTVDLEGQPFWQALRTVAPKLGLFLYPYTQQEGITLATWSNGETAGLEQNSWPCLFVAHKLERVQVFTQLLNAPQPVGKTDNLRLYLTAFIDPKVRFQAQRSNLRLDEIVDEEGHSLVGNKTMPLNIYNNNNGTPFFALNMLLKQPPGLGHHIARFRAALRLVVVAKQETWETPNIITAREVSKTVDDKTYTVLQFEKQGENYVAHLRLSAVAQMPDAPLSSEAFSNVRLLDAVGHEYHRGNVNTNYSPQGMIMNITFVRSGPQNTATIQFPPGEPTKLVWTFTTQFRTVEVPFEFDNLPLP